MTNKIFVDNIRKIARTEDIEKRLPQVPPSQDKGRILGNRGVGLTTAETVYNPCQQLYGYLDGLYTFADLVDGVAGPKVQDTNSSDCAKINTITGLRETGVSPNLTICLKPDGVLIPKNYEVWYVCQFAFLGQSFGMDPDPTFIYFYGSIQDAMTAALVAIEDYLPISASIISTTPFMNLGIFYASQTYVNGETANEGHPLSFTKDTIFNISSSDIVDTIYGSHTIYDSIMSLPKSYDFASILGTGTRAVTIPQPNSTAPISGQSPFTVGGGMLVPSSIPTIPTQTFELILDIASGLWKSDPTDTEAPLKYNSGVSIVAFEFGPTYTRKGEVHPAKDGGFMLYEVSAPGVPINNVYVYRHDRTLSAIVPAAQISSYYP